MNELVQKTDQLILIIERLVESILQENYKIEEEYKVLIRKSLLITIPDIVRSYLRPELSKQQHDMLYWTETLKQITEAMEKNDKFHLVDVLYFECKENLIIFRDMIQNLEKNEE